MTRVLRPLAHVLDKCFPPIQRKVEGDELRYDPTQTNVFRTVSRMWKKETTDVSLKIAHPPWVDAADTMGEMSLIPTWRNDLKTWTRFASNHPSGAFQNGWMETLG